MWFGRLFQFISILIKSYCHFGNRFCNVKPRDKGPGRDQTERQVYRIIGTNDELGSYLCQFAGRLQHQVDNLSPIAGAHMLHVVS